VNRHMVSLIRAHAGAIPRYARKALALLAFTAAIAAGTGLYVTVNGLYAKVTAAPAENPPSPTPGGMITSPSQPLSSPAAMSGQLMVPPDTLIDFDQNPPAMEPAVSRDGPPSIDLKVGPDGLYPPNSWLWVDKGSGSCQAQAASSAGFEHLVLLTEYLQPRAGSSVRLCIITSALHYGVLEVSSVDNDQRAPYLIRYSF
jgi:hypothetical protein